jgi:hypothetical protein
MWAMSSPMDGDVRAAAVARGETELDVLADATRMPGVPYLGKVAVTPDGGRGKPTVVDIVIRVK